MNAHHWTLLTLSLCGVAGPAFAEADAGIEAPPAAPTTGADVTDLSLEALLDIPVEVATRDVRSARAAPGVVYVLTREDILASGARDLLEVLQLVPGFTFHSDVEGAVGVGFRGIWGHEGKVLLMVDGQELNEPLYSTTQFGHHVLVHAISRVEVIRGPGSAVYGGNAELAVINVITRTAEELRGAELAARYAQAPGAFGDWSAGLSAGWRRPEHELDIAVHAEVGQGRRSTGTFTDFSGATSAQVDDSRVDPLTVGLNVKWKRLKARVLYDDYAVGARVGFGEVLGAPATLRFRTLLGDLQADVPVGAVTLKPRVSARLYLPWQSTDAASELFYDKSATRVLAGLGVGWEPLEGLSLLGGVEGYWDHAWLNDKRILGAQSQFGTENTVSYGNGAAYVQALWDNPWVNLSGGLRAELHSQYGLNLAPRIAATRSFGRVNLKAIYSGAFRSPSIENINLAATIRPERTHVGELEVGVQPLDWFYASVNGFYTALSSPIVYGYDAATMQESYVNGGALSTAGAEAVATVRGRFGFATASYSLAVPVVADGVDTFLVPGQPGRLLGMPTHKVTVTGRFKPWRGLFVGGSFVLLTDRYALVPSDVLDGTGVVGRQGEGALLSLNAGYENLGLDGLTLQVGVGNVLGQNVTFVQPYDGGLAPLPGRGRELFVRLSWAIRE